MATALDDAGWLARLDSDSLLSDLPGDYVINTQQRSLGPNFVMWFHEKDSPPAMRLQLSTNATGGCTEVARRVVRLCHHELMSKYDDGVIMQKAALVQFRGELLQRAFRLRAGEDPDASQSTGGEAAMQSSVGEASERTKKKSSKNVTAKDVHRKEKAGRELGKRLKKLLAKGKTSDKTVVIIL